jgi:hypothetical protein
MKKILLTLFIASVIMTGCVPFSSRVYHNIDPVRQTDRYRVEFLLRSIEYRTPMSLLEKSFLKVIDKTGTKVNYTIYDQLSMRTSAGQINDTVFIMVDGQVFPKKTEGLTLVKRSGVSTSTEQVMTADSTLVDIVSGVETQTWKEASFHYSISPLLAAKMRAAADMRFIYYIGPHIITTKLDQRQLKRLRKLIEMKPESANN